MKASPNGEVKVCARGHSMSPFIEEGAWLILRARGEGAFKRGDVALVEAPNGGDLLCHRIVSVRSEQVLLKGDANAAADGWFPRSTVLARAVRIEHPGRPARDLDSLPERLLAQAVAISSPYSAPLRRLGRPLWRLWRAIRRAQP